MRERHSGYEDATMDEDEESGNHSVLAIMNQNGIEYNNFVTVYPSVYDTITLRNKFGG